MKIDDIDINDRPREKLINNGASSLSNIELLAIMLASGTKSEGVLELSARLIKEYGFSRLFDMSYYELKSIKGIKEAKATRLMALFEIARRIMKEKKPKSSELITSTDVFNYIKVSYQLLKTELLSVIFVNAACSAIDIRCYSDESPSDCLVPFRRIVNEAINLHAFGIFLVHNHPSGDLTPSRGDIESTKTLINILKPLNIHVFDHLIVNGDRFYSFSDNHTLLSFIK